MKKILLSLCIATAFSTSGAMAQSNSTVDWMDSTLPATQYIGVDAETLNSAGQWVTQTGILQPFKTSADRIAKKIYFRKDETDLTQTFYGELYTYDANNVRIHSETFPHDDNIDGKNAAWDIRADRFRLFVQTQANGSAVTQNLGVGMVLAPIDLSNPNWSYSELGDTYLCGVSGSQSAGYTHTNGFQQINSTPSTCMPYQQGVTHPSNTATIVQNYNILEGGPTATLLPSVPSGSTIAGSLPTVFQSALIISQVSRLGDGTMSRERFIFGYNNGTYYGIIRWDASTWSAGSWVLTGRTIGLEVLNYAPGITFSGMQLRAQSDQTLIPATPQNLANSCVANNGYANLSWTPVPGATHYLVRISDLTSGAFTQVDNNPGASYIFKPTPGHALNWWVHAANSAVAADGSNASDPLGVPSWTSNCGSQPDTAPPAAPANLRASCLGNIMTLQWDQLTDSTGYDIRVQDTAYPWNPGGTEPNQVLVNNVQSTSYTYVVTGLTSGHNFVWWMNSRNGAGAGTQSVGGPGLTCPNYSSP